MEGCVLEVVARVLGCDILEKQFGLKLRRGAKQSHIESKNTKRKQDGQDSSKEDSLHKEVKDPSSER